MSGPSEFKLHDGTVNDLIALLSSLPADVRNRPVRVFDDGSTTSKVSVELWPTSGRDDGPVVVIDCDF